MTPMQYISFGKRMINIYKELCQPVCAKYEMNSTCLDIILFLANHPEYSTARDLYAVRGIKSGNASVAVESLIKNGYLERADDAADRRIKHLKLTEKAASVVEDGRKAQKVFIELMNTGVTEEEHAALVSVTKKLSENLERLEKAKDAALTDKDNK